MQPMGYNKMFRGIIYRATGRFLNLFIKVIFFAWEGLATRMIKISENTSKTAKFDPKSQNFAKNPKIFKTKKKYFRKKKIRFFFSLFLWNMNKLFVGSGFFQLHLALAKFAFGKQVEKASKIIKNHQKSMFFLFFFKCKFPHTHISVRKI